MKTLVAHDDPLTLSILMKALAALGLDPVRACDGNEAWGRLLREDFPLVVAGRVVAGVDGLELCRKVRGRVAGPSYTYVILLTAGSSPGDRAEGFEAGADDVITSPVDSAELSGRVGVARRIIAFQEDLQARAGRLESVYAELRERCERLSEAATSDVLTGLKNRLFFHEALEAGFSFAGRQKLPVSVVMVDVDDFKPYNDTFGHPAGDGALSDLGRLLRENVREHDLVARYGGEEFVLLLPATDGPSAAYLCERLRSLVASHPWPLRAITASFGVSTSSAGTAQAAQLVDEADRALYSSKRRGRNCVTHFDGSVATPD